jgi:hypothetical protein
MFTTLRRLCGHESMGPSGVEASTSDTSSMSPGLDLPTFVLRRTESVEGHGPARL